MNSILQAGPLPKNTDFDADGRSAWRLLLSAEEEAGKERQKAVKYKDHLIAVRVLGFFLIDFFEHSASHRFFMIAYKHLLHEINSCFAVGPTDGSQYNATQHAKVFELGLVYRNQLTRVFRSDTGHVPEPASHTSRPSYDQGRLEMMERMQRANKTEFDAKSGALLRDGYKCMITGKYDVWTIDKFPEVGQKVKKGGVDIIQCIHLFSESAQDANKPLEYAATAFTLLGLFGLDGEVRSLLGGQVNSLSNVLSLNFTMRWMFDTLGLWFEEVPGQENTYNLVLHHPGLKYYYPRLPKQVTFAIDPDCAALCEEGGAPLPPLPSKALIGIRAACARVAHVSGAAEQADQILQDKEDSTVLAHDGTTGDLLNTLLNARSVVPPSA